MGSVKSTAFDVTPDRQSAAEIDTLELEVGALVFDTTNGVLKVCDGTSWLSVKTDVDLGWGAYSDTQYTAISPFSISADTDTVLPNNALSRIETHLPSGLDEFYDGSVITGLNGQSLVITIDFVAEPQSAGATYIENWIDIGGSVGELYRRINTFPKGNGVERNIVNTTLVYTLDTWEANGGTVYVRSNGPVDIHSIRYVISRIYKP